MFANLSDLAMLELTPSAAAMDYAAERETCAFCGVPPMPAAPELAVRWCRQFLPSIGESERGQDDYVRLRRLAYDSRLVVVVPMSVEQLDALLATDPESHDLVEDGLVTVACGNCASKDVPVESLADVLVGVMASRYGDGNEAAARAQPVWEAFERMLGVLNGTSGTRTASGAAG